MKNPLFALLAFALSGSFLNAENYFVQDARWVYYGEALVGGTDIPYTDIFTLETARTVDGFECNELYFESDFCPTPESVPAPKALVALVRRDGDKVMYSLPVTQNARWSTLYDFSLIPGEECEVGTIVGPLNLCSEFTPRSVRCKESIVSEYFDNLPALVMEDADRDPDPYSRPRQDLWIVGIGNDYSLLENSGYSNIRFDNWRILNKFSIGDRIIYSGKPALQKPEESSLTVNSAETPIPVTVSGKTICTTGKISLLSSAGTKLSEGYNSVEAPGCGVFIALTEHGAVKVAVR